MLVKKSLLLFCFFSFIVCTAQTKQISGKIVTKTNVPLVGASVYLNNTSIGDYTNDEGVFMLNVPPGEYQMVVSYIGFLTKTITVNTETFKTGTVIEVTESNNLLDEIVVSAKKKKPIRRRVLRRYLKKFTQTFIGESSLAQDCEILNPEVLEFSFIDETKTLVASSKKPIKIKNNALGYIISYDLKYYNLNDQQVSYLGYSKFEKMQPKKDSQAKKWEENRKKAYLGSKQHFLKSLIYNDIDSEGFKIDLIEVKKNPKKPSIEAVTKANKYITAQKQRGKPVDFSKRVTYPVSKLDSAVNIIIDQNLSPTITKVTKKNVSVSSILLPIAGQQILKFPGYIQVTYKNEKEDKNYTPRKSRKDFQVSVLQLLNQSASVTLNGTFKNPLNVRITGYWAFEQFGDELPLDYKLPN